jgi:hypothetical protein
VAVRMPPRPPGRMTLDRCPSSTEKFRRRLARLAGTGARGQPRAPAKP